MFTIPHEFKENDYITIPPLKIITKEVLPRNTFSDTYMKDKLIENIEEFARISDENTEIINNWLDETIAEGIKEVHVKYINTNTLNTVNIIDNDLLITNKLEKELYDTSNRHFNNKFNEDYSIFRYDIDYNVNGKCIKIYLGKLISHYDKRNSTASNVPYPIYIEIYVEKGIVVGRAKSKSNMYGCMKNFNVDKAKSTTADKEIEEATNYIGGILSIDFLSKHVAEAEFKNNLYHLLESVTETPEEIINLMSNKQAEIDNVVNILMQGICCLDKTYLEDLISNVSNLVEKYFSISCKDKSIFKKNKIAYPLKLDATDEEESKVTQTAAEEEPLQSKAIYFDNKKMLQKSKSCNDCTFAFYRKNKLYYGEKFKVKISTKQNYCVIKFSEYTAEEDIKNVLFSFIDIKQNLGTRTN